MWDIVSPVRKLAKKLELLLSPRDVAGYFRSRSGLFVYLFISSLTTRRSELSSPALDPLELGSLLWPRRTADKSLRQSRIQPNESFVAGLKAALIMNLERSTRTAARRLLSQLPPDAE